MTRTTSIAVEAKPAAKTSAKPASKPRRHPRTKPPRGFLVAWQGAGRRDANRAHNVSLGGIFIENPDPPEPGTVLQLLFDTMEGEISVSAKICFVKPRDGMGVQFLGMDFPARRRLYGMLRRLIA